MPNFKYSAQNQSGQVVDGLVEAQNRESVFKILVEQKIKPISISETKKKTKGINLNIGGKKITSKSLVVFTRQLSTMVSAGVPLLRALTTLGQQSDNAGLKEALGQVTVDVQAGLSLADAFAKHPKAFNDVYVNMVRAGEAGGILDDILKRLAMQQEKSDSIKKKVKSAMTYPVILLIITIGAFFGLMLFVIPQIGTILKDLGGEDAQLPPITLAMLAISDAMQTYWYIFIGGFAGGFIFLRRYIKSPVGKRQFDKLLLKIPAVGNIVTKVSVARFARVFASLVGAGVSVLEALRTTADAVGNTAFRDEILAAAEEVKNGKPLSASLTESPLFPAIVAQMLAVGEETGQTDTILIKVADFYEEEVDALIESISSIIEPVMIVVMGGMVGLIAYSVMGPIASLSQNIDG